MELIRDTFGTLNCRIVYLNELKYMMGLDGNVVISIFSKMVMYNNIAIIETITSFNFYFVLNLLTHLDIFNIEDIRPYGINIVICKNSKDTTVRTITASALNIFEGFMKCINYLTRKCVIYVIIKRHVLENAQNMKIRFVLNVSIIITKTMIIHVLVVHIIL